jgi:hypothetical protein
MLWFSSQHTHLSININEAPFLSTEIVKIILDRGTRIIYYSLKAYIDEA